MKRFLAVLAIVASICLLPSAAMADGWRGGWHGGGWHGGGGGWHRGGWGWHGGWRGGWRPGVVVVPPAYGSYWVPAHYDAWGRWIPGHYAY